MPGNMDTVVDPQFCVRLLEGVPLGAVINDDFSFVGGTHNDINGLTEFKDPADDGWRDFFGVGTIITLVPGALRQYILFTSLDKLLHDPKHFYPRSRFMGELGSDVFVFERLLELADRTDTQLDQGFLRDRGLSD